MQNVCEREENHGSEIRRSISTGTLGDRRSDRYGGTCGARSRRSLLWFRELVNNNPRRNYLFSPFAGSRLSWYVTLPIMNPSYMYVYIYIYIQYVGWVTTTCAASDRIYLATGPCKRCAARITPSEAILLFYLASLFHPLPPLLARLPSFLRQTVRGRERAFLFFLSCLYHLLSGASYFTFVLASGGAIVHRVENRTSASLPVGCACSLRISLSLPAREFPFPGTFFVVTPLIRGWGNMTVEHDTREHRLAWYRVSILGFFIFFLFLFEGYS